MHVTRSGYFLLSDSLENPVIEPMQSDAYEQAQGAERTTWEALSLLSVADPDYPRALARWHGAVQAMSQAMEGILALRPGAGTSGPGPGLAALPDDRLPPC